MASIEVKCFTSSDRGAPVLNGTPGSMRALLDACLVTGFNSMPIRAVSVVNGAVRLSLDNGHGFEFPNVVSIAGVAPESSIGEYRILKAGSDWVEINAVTSLALSAGASVSRASLGWSKGPGSGNVASYVPKMASANPAHLFIDDTNTIAGSNSGCFKTIVSGFNSVDVNGSGVDLFFSGAWVKSTALNSNAVKWIVIGSDGVFYLFVDVLESSQTIKKYYTCSVFGCLKSNDLRPHQIYIGNSVDKDNSYEPKYYLSASPRYFGPSSRVIATRGCSDLGLVGVPAVANRLIGARHGLGKSLKGQAITADDYITAGDGVIGKSAGVLLSLSYHGENLELMEGRFLCVPTVVAGGEWENPGNYDNYVGVVIFDILGPWE